MSHENPNRPEETSTPIPISSISYWDMLFPQSAKQENLDHQVKSDLIDNEADAEQVNDGPDGERLPPPRVSEEKGGEEKSWLPDLVVSVHDSINEQVKHLVPELKKENQELIDLPAKTLSRAHKLATAPASVLNEAQATISSSPLTKRIADHLDRTHKNLEDARRHVLDSPVNQKPQVAINHGSRAVKQQAKFVKDQIQEQKDEFGRSLSKHGETTTGKLEKQSAELLTDTASGGMLGKVFPKEVSSLKKSAGFAAQALDVVGRKLLTGK